MRRILRAIFWGRRALLTVPLVAVTGFVGFTTARYRLLDHGHSYGSRTGIVRKLSFRRSSKGLPLCRYSAGELVLTGSQPGNVADVWEFTVDDDRTDSPVVKRIHEAEKNGERITLDYRQDLRRWWSCAETEYYVTGVE
jgi:hypothetical protein